MKAIEPLWKHIKRLSLLQQDEREREGPGPKLSHKGSQSSKVVKIPTKAGLQCQGQGSGGERMRLTYEKGTSGP